MMRQQGFGLLELMVVTGIITILGAIAIPQYNAYVTRARVTEALHHTQVYARKLAVGSGGLPAEAPTGLEYIKIKKSGEGTNMKVTASLKTSINSMAVFGNPKIPTGTILVLTPDNSQGPGQWACTSNLPPEFMPKMCVNMELSRAQVEAVVKEATDVAGPTVWVKGTTDKDACWDQEYADGIGEGNGWVEGATSYAWWRQHEVVSESAGLSTVVHQLLACTD